MFEIEGYNPAVNILGRGLVFWVKWGGQVFIRWT